jgi:hypothetical protein
MTDSTAETCGVHTQGLEVRNVRIAYGLITNSVKVSPAYLNARHNSFPNCDDIVLGGCVVRSEKTLPRKVCPECCAARDAWLRENHAKWAKTHALDGL